jgi:hypothetical protein
LTRISTLSGRTVLQPTTGGSIMMHRKFAEEEQESTIIAQSSTRPGRRSRQARLMRVINVPMRFLLRLPVATPLSGQLMLLYLTGRKSGKRYQQPVSYVPDGDSLLTPGGGNWKLNLREDQPIRARIRGRDVRLRPEIIADLDEVERLLRRMMTANPRVTRFVPVMGPDGRIDRVRLEAAVRYGFRIIRWHSVRPQSGHSASDTAR